MKKTWLPVDKKKKPLIVSKNVRIYRLKITMVESKPPIWRYLLVRGDMSLGFLHAAFQVAMGWTNSHLHHFIIEEKVYSDPRMNEVKYEDEKLDLDEWATSLMEAVPRRNQNFIYEYDFGDSWSHLVEVEAIHTDQNILDGLVMCVEGARSCPPEDCGGIWGYEEFLQAIKDPQHEERQSMKEWIGRPFNPEAFDADKTNRYLKKLKKPKITDEQLARVLLERGGG